MHDVELQRWEDDGGLAYAPTPAFQTVALTFWHFPTRCYLSPEWERQRPPKPGTAKRRRKLRRQAERAAAAARGRK